ncbi:MAG: PIN domain-containing protein [Bacteroidales bacterium]
MNKIIIDTNILFSALLNTDSRIGQILINGKRYYDFYAPEYIREEIIEHKDKIKTIAKLSDNDFIKLYELILRNITILNHTLIPTNIYIKAEKLCETIDLDDTIFVAVAEFTRGKLWTGDKKLINGLSEKGYKRLIRTEEIYRDFISKRKRKK